MGSGAVWLAAGLAIATSAALSAVLAWCGPIDRPRDRGLSTAPTPTAGGLALMGGMLVALLASLPALRADGAGPPFTAACAVALAHGLLGALDDVVDFGARTKLLAQLIMAFGFAVLVHPARMPLGGALAIDLPWPIAMGGVALWIIVVTNAVNFMDGSNGLIASALAIVLGGLGLRALGGEDAGAGLGLMAASGACLGFLPWNFPKATLFQGDAGALFLGALVAALAVVAAGGGRPDADLNLLAAPIALTPLLTDVLLTLIARLRRAQRLTEAHRDHLYQRWLVAHGGDHTALARRVWVIMGGYTLLAVSVAEGDPMLAWAALTGGVGVAVAGWLWLDRRVRG
jgi:UDP-N-acetylmuramyl pentapeptide phosphotransferase/UDP-N-acetylglucosamine-1-phosphate transferase